MSDQPTVRKPGYSSLRSYRWSAAGVDYFVTFNTRRPASALNEPSLAALLTAQRDRLEADGSWAIRSWVIMPDHIHILFTLDEKISLAGCLRLFKGRMTPA